MAIDVTSQVGAIIREVSSREIDGQLARVVVASRVYDTDKEDLWDALTNIERIPRWFMPISGDLRLGGHYQLEGNAGGEILVCDRPDHFQITWGMGQGPASWVDVQLTSLDDNRTAMQMEHVAFVPDEMWHVYGPGAVGVGWDGGLMGLDLYLSGNTSLTPEMAGEWAGTEEGRSFYEQSSAAWAAAAVASGIDPATAAFNEANTTAFYLGEDTGAE